MQLLLKYKAFLEHVLLPQELKIYIITSSLHLLAYN
jgi:hypothetical protein